MKYLYTQILKGGYNLYMKSFDVITTISDERVFTVSVHKESHDVEYTIVTEPINVKWDREDFERALMEVVVNYHSKHLMNTF